jgi:hypothetical protein
MNTLTNPGELLQRINAIDAAPQGQTILFVNGNTPLGCEPLQIVVSKDNTRVDYRAPSAPLGYFALEWMLNETVGRRMADKFHALLKLGRSPSDARKALRHEAEQLTNHHHVN